MSVAYSVSPTLVVLVLFVGGCGDDEVELPHEEFMGHYTTAKPNQAHDSLVHFDIRADNTVIYQNEDACGEYLSETIHAWEPVDENTIVITNAGGGWIDGTYKIRVTPNDSCDELVFEHFTANLSLYTYTVYRGELCLSAVGGQCTTSWCTAAPKPCS